MTTDDLSRELHKSYNQKSLDKEYFTQNYDPINEIHEAIGDHASRITFLSKTLWNDKSLALDQTAQNAALATHHDGLIKQGLSLLETQVTANGAATAELRVDVQYAVNSIAQQQTANAASTSSSA